MNELNDKVRIDDSDTLKHYDVKIVNCTVKSDRIVLDYTVNNSVLLFSQLKFN